MYSILVLVILVLKVNHHYSYSGLGKIDCSRYSIAIFDCDILYFLFIECNGAFAFLNEYRIMPCLYFSSAQFDIPYSILFNRRYVITLFLLTNFFGTKKEKTKKKILKAKLLIGLLSPSFVFKLPHECEDITKNARRTPLNAQCNRPIEYRLQYSLFFTFLNYHRNRLFLYFLVNNQISIISLLFLVSIPNPARARRFSRQVLDTRTRKLSTRLHL